MKSIRISSTYIMSLDGVYVDKSSVVNEEHLLSLLDNIAMFFTCLYVESAKDEYYRIYKYVSLMISYVGKLDASDICSSLHHFLTLFNIDELSMSHMKIVVL